MKEEEKPFTGIISQRCRIADGHRTGTFSRNEFDAEKLFERFTGPARLGERPNYIIYSERGNDFVQLSVPIDRNFEQREDYVGLGRMCLAFKIFACMAYVEAPARAGEGEETRCQFSGFMFVPTWAALERAKGPLIWTQAMAALLGLNNPNEFKEESATATYMAVKQRIITRSKP